MNATNVALALGVVLGPWVVVLLVSTAAEASRARRDGRPAEEQRTLAAAFLAAVVALGLGLYLLARLLGVLAAGLGVRP